MELGDYKIVTIHISYMSIACWTPLTYQIILFDVKNVKPINDTEMEENC